MKVEDVVRYFLNYHKSNSKRKIRSQIIDTFSPNFMPIMGMFQLVQ